ncbi:MAG TPA: UDP-N-acetylenolpyruvoylglucosamine reductase, partial [Microbacterium sp.]|nr:UDP-N-acetylenolpyruvoylglucosamine reductase [Microbacterium sp.]
RSLPPECPRWPVEPDLDPVLVIPLAVFDGHVPTPETREPDVKVSAAWLIEQAGLRKGFRLTPSRAGLSTKH